jgi:DNA-binding CsgD family transcriptional regulator
LKEIDRTAKSLLELSSITGLILFESEPMVRIEELLAALNHCIEFETCFVAFVHKDAIWEVEYDAMDNRLLRSSISHTRRFDVSTYTRNLTVGSDFRNTFLWSSHQVAGRELNQAPVEVNGIGCVSAGCSLQLNEHAKFMLSLSSRKKTYEHADQVVLSGITALLSACLSRLSLSMRETENNLTKKEMEIMTWVTRGKTSHEIGKILEITERTVKFHLSNVYLKLGVCNRAQAAAAVNNLELT